MGRFGLVRGSKIERLYREARPMRIYEGSTEVILDSLAKKLVKDRQRMIIDCHMHVWPDHIAQAMQAQRPAGMPLRFDGTLSGLLRTMDEAGIDKGLALGVGIKASTVARTNEFIGVGAAGPPRADRDRPPRADASTRTSRRCRTTGSSGSSCTRCSRTCPSTTRAVHEILAALAQEGMPVVTHVGAGEDEAANERGAPKLLRTLADALPDLTLIACHYGGYHRLDEAEEHVVGIAGHPRDVVAADHGRARPRAGRRDHPAARGRPRRLRLGLADGRPGRRDGRHPGPRR